jgi:hypothetical protein
MQTRANVFKLFLGVIAVVFTASVAISAQESNTQTLTGVVSDTTCNGGTHVFKNMTPAECTRECARRGKYALVVGRDAYTLRGHDGQFNKNAGQTVTVEGTVSAKTVNVKSVTPTKKA